MRKLKPTPLYENAEIVVFDKPTGLPTHSPDRARLGFAEYAELCLGQKLWVVHRLDKETSGVLLLAKSAEAAKKWSALFAQRRVEKEYTLLVSNRERLNKPPIVVRSHIRKSGPVWVNDPELEPNSETRFDFPDPPKNSLAPRLLRARPLTGKTHQIRLHAKLLGTPILGDALYEGQNFPRLALHAEKFKAQEVCFSSPLPLELALHSELELGLEFQCALTRAGQLLSFQEQPQECFRFYSTDTLRIDRLGEVLWVYDYRQAFEMTHKQQQLYGLAEALGCKHWGLQQMQDRGKDPIKRELATSPGFPENWTATENGVLYEFRREQGLSPGLFVDQRENRLWIRQNSSKLRVLNLFAYTAGFSVNAALGEAREVVTVDLSKNFVAWSKVNFELNRLEPGSHEFWAADSFFFLDRAARKNRLFDLIICDPPSFSRSKQGVFRIKEDLARMIKQMRAVLAPRGQILLSTNYEGWKQTELEHQVHQAAPDLVIEPLPPVSPDNLIHGLSLMKAVRLRAP